MASGHFSTTPFLPSVFFLTSSFRGPHPPVRSVFRHPRPFIFSPSLLPSAGPLTNPLGSAPSRTLWGAPSREFFGKPPLTDPLANPLPRTLWHSITTPVMEWFSPFFFEPSRASEARCRRQEPREGVPKRTGACERGGEARRREPWWEVNDHLPNNRCATPVGL